MYYLYLLAFLPVAFAISGIMTFWEPSVGSCGAYSTKDDMVVAISKDIMNNYNGGNPNHNPLCFTHITITNSAGVSQDATIVDTCESCLVDHIEVTEPLFQKFDNPDKGHTQVSWTGNAFHKREELEAAI